MRGAGNLAATPEKESLSGIVSGFFQAALLMGHKPQTDGIDYRFTGNQSLWSV
jgi:hypothetical protein